MKIYKNLEEVLKDVKNDVLEIDGDVKFEFSLKADFSLKIAGNITAMNITTMDISAWNITAMDISAKNILARNITAMNITTRMDISAWNITTMDISAWNITAMDISAKNILARNISARNITAMDISAGNIIYYAVCFAYKNILCLSIKGKRKNCKHFCLDGKIELKI